MKRNSITAIIYKVQYLTYKSTEIPYTCSHRINKAAVNEIIRLQAEDTFPKIDMKAESEKFLDSVKTICEDYNAKILNK